MKITSLRFLKKANTVDPISNARRIDYQFHRQSLEELATNLETSLMSGLSSTEAATLLAKNGKNLIKPHSQNIFLKMISYLFTGFCGLLWQAFIFIKA